MSDYGKLYNRIWGDAEFTALEARPQQVFAMLLSFPTRNNAGVLPLTLKRWANATADATVENVTEALTTLEKARFIIVDWDTEEVLIRTFIRNDEIYRQPNMMKSALKDVVKTESLRIRLNLKAELHRLPTHKDEARTIEIANGLVGTLPEGYEEPQANPSQTLPDAIPDGCVVVTSKEIDIPTSTTTSPTNDNTNYNSPSGGELALAEQGKSTRARKLPEGWMPKPETVEAIKAQFPSFTKQVFQYEHQKFTDHFVGNGKPMKDWDAAWRNWMRRVAERQGAAGTPAASEPKGADGKAQGWDRIRQEREQRRGGN